MFYVIGSEIQSRVLLSTAPANRTKGVVEQFGTSGVPIPCRVNPTYGGTLVFSCATIIQIHHLSVKILKVSHYIRNFRGRFSTGFGKDLEKLPQVIADGNGILSIAVLRW